MEKIGLFILIGFFVFVFGFILFGMYNTFSGRAQSRWIGRNIRVLKDALEDNKDLIQDLGKLSSDIQLQTQKNIYENNEEDLRYVSKKSADIEAEAIYTKAKAFKKAFSGTTQNTPKRYCRYCGEAIEMDSIYCDMCGKKQ